MVLRFFNVAKLRHSLATLAPIEEAQMIDAHGGGEQSKRFILHYNFPPFSVGETGGQAAWAA
jgi:polyribonucleotide nucleotidyltransferase